MPPSGILFTCKHNSKWPCDFSTKAARRGDRPVPSTTDAGTLAGLALGTKYSAMLNREGA